MNNNLSKYGTEIGKNNSTDFQDNQESNNLEVVDADQKNNKEPNTDNSTKPISNVLFIESTMIEPSIKKIEDEKMNMVNQSKKSQMNELKKFIDNGETNIYNYTANNEEACVKKSKYIMPPSPYLEDMSSNSESENSSDDKCDNIELATGMMKPKGFHGSFTPACQVNKIKNIDNLEDKIDIEHIDEINKTTDSFIDPLFPHGDQSVQGHMPILPNNLRNLSWLRPGQYKLHSKKSSPIVLYNEILTDDIVQGSLANCYFLSALASIAQHPKRLERLFLKKNISDDGVYTVLLCIGGLWEKITVDDYFPCNSKTGLPKFTHSFANELWVMLLEKAWAKVHGGYLSMRTGFSREALRSLTGASTSTIMLKNLETENLWEKLIKWTTKNYILTTSSKNLKNGSDEYDDSIGISGSHSYSFLGVFELTQDGDQHSLVDRANRHLIEDKNQIVRLVKLRNPWGRGEWLGDWSDQDPRWHTDLQEELGVESRDDGIFFMEFKDYLTYFKSVQLCKYIDGYSYSAIKLQTPANKPCIINFTTSVEGKYYFAVNQYCKKFYPSESDYDYSNILVLVMQETNDGLMIIDSNINSDLENYISHRGEPATYYIYIKAFWRSFVDEFGFSVYGPSDVDIDKVDKLPYSTIQNAFLRLARNNKSMKIQEGKSTRLQYAKYRNKKGLGYFYFKNTNEDKSIDISLELTEITNMHLFPPYFGQHPYFRILPQEDAVLAYETTDPNYKAKFRVWSSFIADYPQTIEFAINKGAKETRVYNGNTLDICCYVYEYSKGIAYYYINNEKGLTLNEEMAFELNGCYIAGVTGNRVEIFVEPGQSKLVIIFKRKDESSFTVDLIEKNTRIFEY